MILKRVLSILLINTLICFNQYLLHYDTFPAYDIRWEPIVALAQPNLKKEKDHTQQKLAVPDTLTNFRVSLMNCFNFGSENAIR